VAGDRGVLRIRQAELRQAGARAHGRARGRFHAREEAVGDEGRDFVAREFGADRAADQLRAAARHDDRPGGGIGVGQQVLLGAAAGVGEGAHLPGVELGAVGLQLACDQVGQREVHVVAAQQDMVADGDAVRFQLAVALEDGDQREVAGAAADVDHQHDVAGLHLLAPAAAAALDPAVQGRLRLFQQGRAAVAGVARRFGGQFARARVEGCGNRHGDGLLVERRFRMRGVPGIADVLEVAGRCRPAARRARLLPAHRRQDGGAAVHARVAQPALGRGHQADRRAGAAAARHLANHGCAAWPSVQGRASSPGASSSGCGRYMKDGSSGSASTVPGPLSCGIGSTPWSAFSPSLACRSTYDRALWVVPRSMPMA
jgi:hypothetical protein